MSNNPCNQSGVSETSTCKSIVQRILSGYKPGEEKANQQIMNKNEDDLMHLMFSKEVSIQYHLTVFRASPSSEEFKTYLPQLSNKNSNYRISKTIKKH